jgi:CRISPR system Cascade subunit CasD
MSTTLLLRLAAPLQSWGVGDKFKQRRTEREPTKSGIVGLLAAALGRKREEDISDLTALKFGVRIDQPGELLQDYHIIHRQTLLASPKENRKVRKPLETTVTRRFYLSDAIFLVGLEGGRDFLLQLDNAIKSPVFPLYLGRRSCPPEGKISLGLREESLRRALLAEPWLATGEFNQRNQDYRATLVCDADHPTALRRRDQPVSFAASNRRYAERFIEDRIEHDPFIALEE